MNFKSFASASILFSAALLSASSLMGGSHHHHHGSSGNHHHHHHDSSGNHHHHHDTISFTVENLTSNIPGAAAHLDPNLVNPWGMVFNKGAIFVADNGTDLATSYTPEGAIRQFVVNVDSEPTGLALNKTDKFIINLGNLSAPAELIFATEEGTILGFARALNTHNAVVAADRSFVNAVYKGLEIAFIDHEPFLYATDFFGGKVDVFDGNFNFVMSFTDPNIPEGFAPFNIALIKGFLIVTFAKQEPPENTDDEPGPGNGFVDVFTKDGRLVKRLISDGPLNSPWGLALAPKHFGKFSGALLVGNFGDGRINAFDVNDGTFLGALADKSGRPISIDGLWSIKFAPENFNKSSSDSSEEKASLYFTAGPNDEADGLLGVIRPERH